jgi:hypothetical protein
VARKQKRAKKNSLANAPGIPPGIRTWRNFLSGASYFSNRAARICGSIRERNGSTFVAEFIQD